MNTHDRLGLGVSLDSSLNLCIEQKRPKITSFVPIAVAGTRFSWYRLEPCGSRAGCVQKA